MNQIRDTNKINQQKLRFEIKISFTMSKELVRKISEKNFPTPPSLKATFNSHSAKSADESTATLTSVKDEEELQYHQLISSKIASGDNKLKKILKYFVKFEEALNHILNPENIKIFQAELFVLLGKILMDKKLYEAYNFSKLSLSIACLAAGKIGINSENFMKLMKTKFKLPSCRFKRLHRSSCYIKIKNLYLCP